ncbi:prolipoprotein diacylglyceryl transferase [Beutenbergia cavernae DSM 12333]|uniref:Phosphatidylglycerol--prolipoprotein diacylglyceryl transferase n=1 Tax=Beutenbergia cavernae (strain ATCC BAA-8 / DSM 12333 / CCUG 43141 / JCM 11478 / NBRC 16432 / NCIMB 13614 / HKI 0122) TaxID=471853 RepID=C5BV82_BEUC1|nr:prolipoprotein diacylglyceryl transferase [Beutenbergia cavernae]ACQ80469.1 prolipoprotein diacylglyceryl transferase [Beutenbergia cavernae DSM 12333]
MIGAAGIPSPPQGVWYLGPLPLRAYALAILLGGVVAAIILTKRYVARGGPGDKVLDIVFWAVPFGIVGARLYHVFSSPDAYFGPGGNPVAALYIWNGGLGIWGAIALGAVGAWIGLRRAGLRLAPFADALAPGLLVAQAIGRLGNWFNQELFGTPTTLPWGLQISGERLRELGMDYPEGTLFHPTFLYELVWNLAAAALLVYLDRRFRLGHGRVFWLYVVFYTLGRTWIEMLRIDEAEQVLGLRLNVWTSILVLLVALVIFVVLGRRYPGREESVWLPGREPEDQGDADSEERAEEDRDRGHDGEDPTDGVEDDEPADDVAVDSSRDTNRVRTERETPATLGPDADEQDSTPRT